MSEDLAEISRELLSYAQSHPECIESLNHQLEILLADLRSMQAQRSTDKVDYRRLPVWPLLCRTFGENPTIDEVKVVAFRLSEKLQVPIHRTLQRRVDLLMQWLNGYLGDVEQILSQIVVVSPDIAAHLVGK